MRFCIYLTAKTGREIFIDVGDAKEQVFQTFMRNNGLEYDLASMKVYNPSATPLQRAKGKLYTYGQTFDKTIDDFLYRNGGYPASWRRADLTDAEFDALRADLHSRGLLLDTDPEGFLRISRISDSATNAAKTTSHATNATADATRTVNASQPSTPYIPHIEIVDKSGFKAGLEEFINKHYIDPNTGAKSYLIRGDLIGILNREMALEDGILFMDPHYVKNNSVFASELAKQATVPNKNKIITAPVYMEMIDDSEDVLSNFVKNLDNNGIEQAAIPFSSTGHSMLLVKEGKKYTILDQYGNKKLKTWTSNSAKSAVRSKEKVVSALKKAGVKQDDIVLNDYEMCNNMDGTCSIYTNLSAMGALDVLDETGESLHDIVKYHNTTNTKADRWGGTNIEKLVLENSELLIEYAKKALQRLNTSGSASTTGIVTDVVKVSDTATDAGRVASIGVANNAQDLSQQQVLNRAVDINNRTYGTSYYDDSWGDTLEMYKSSGLSRLAENYDVLSRPITNIRGYNVFLEDIPGANGKIGQISGRPIVVVNVNGKKIPFYISTGSAGNGVNKLTVPSGKWEAIFGIEKRTDGAGNFVGSGWFNKGSLSQIEKHYGSRELKQIAEALDDIIGDVRDTKLVTTSARRAANGGIGDTAISTLLPDINNSAALDLINESMTNGAQAYNGSTTNFLANVMDIQNFLSNL